MDEAGMCVLINLNQEDHQIVPQILERSNSLEEGTLKPVNGGYLIPLDTKYYTTQMQLQVFNNLQTASQWATDTKKPVFALFIHCHIAQTSAKLLSQVRDVCRQIKTTTKALLIGGNCSAFHSQVSLLQHFCTNEGIEQIELAPNRETMDLLKEYHERWGIDRMWEILESVDWPCRQLKTNLTNLPAHRQRLQRQIDRLDKEQQGAHESDDDELKDPDLPDSDDEAAILEVFDKYNFGFARMLGNNYLGTLNIANLCDESNFNTERDAKESSPTIAANNITHQCSQDDDAKKAKKKKGKKSKNKSPPEDEADENPSTALSTNQHYVDGNFLSNILDNVLKTSNNQNFKASSFDPTELNWGTDDFSSVIGHLSELKEQGAALHRSERVSMAEKVSYSLLQKIGAVDVEDTKETTAVKKSEQDSKSDKKTV